MAYRPGTVDFNKPGSRAVRNSLGQNLISPIFENKND